MNVKFTLDEGAYKPERAHDTDAGYDLMSREDAVIVGSSSYVFDTGVHIELPSLVIQGEINQCGWPTVHNIITVGFVKSKSGLYFKHNIISTGVVDYSYRGSIKVKLFNLGREYYEVRKGDKISQLVILPILTPDLVLTDKLEETDRGSEGFGSTGR